MILQLHYESVGFLGTHFMIWKAGLRILCTKEDSKKGISISCTNSHHCKSWQGKEERDEKWWIIYQPRVVISVEKVFLSFFFSSTIPPFYIFFNSFQLLCGVCRHNSVFHCLHWVPLTFPTPLAICQALWCSIRSVPQLSFSSATGPRWVDCLLSAAADRAQSLWEPAHSGTALQKVHHCWVFLNMA